jgi:hypothetical protein
MPGPEQIPLPEPEQFAQLPQLSLNEERVDSLPVRTDDVPGVESTNQAVQGERTPQPSLTPEDLRKLEEHRGRPVTPAQEYYMNEARKNGIHRSVV